jgi:hypothetical protein
MGMAGYIVGFVLLGLTLIVLMLSFGLNEGGLANKVVGVFQGKTDKFIKEYDRDSYRGELVKLPENHQEAVLKLNTTIHQMLSSSNKNCFANYATVLPENDVYSGFPLLEEKGTSIIMNYNNGETDFRIYGGAGGQQLVTTLLFSIEDMRPCVIAGSNEVTENFYSSFLKNGQDQAYLNTHPFYHTPVSQIQIKYDVEGNPDYIGDCIHGNAIRVPGDSKEVNVQCNNLLDGGWLFTPDNKQICFFPTNYFVDYSSTGLDDDLVSGNDPRSIRSRMRSGGLTAC